MALLVITVTIIIIFIYPLPARVDGAPKMISQPVFSIFPCSPLPSGTWRTPDTTNALPSLANRPLNNARKTVHCLWSSLKPIIVIISFERGRDQWENLEDRPPECWCFTGMEYICSGRWLFPRLRGFGENVRPFFFLSFFFLKWKLARAHEFHSLGQNQSTMAQQAETTVTWAFPDELRVSSFRDRFAHYAWTAA